MRLSLAVILFALELDLKGILANQNSTKTIFSLISYMFFHENSTKANILKRQILSKHKQLYKICLNKTVIILQHALDFLCTLLYFPLAFCSLVDHYSIQ